MSKRIDAHVHLFSFNETAVSVLTGWIINAFDVIYDVEKRINEDIKRKIYVYKKSLFNENVEEPLFIEIERFVNALVTLTKTPECIYKTLRNLYAEQLKEDSVPLEDEKIIKVIVTNMMDVEYGWNVKSKESKKMVIKSFLNKNDEFMKKRNKIFKIMEDKIRKNKLDSKIYNKIINDFERETGKFIIKEEIKIDVLKNEKKFQLMSTKNEIIEMLEKVNFLLLKTNIKNIDVNIKDFFKIIEDIDNFIVNHKKKRIKDSSYVTIVCYEGLYNELKQKIRNISNKIGKKDKESDLTKTLKIYSTNFIKYIDMIKENQNEVNKSYAISADRLDSVEKQMNSLKRLKEEFKDEIFSFFSVDPRRDDLSGSKTFEVKDFINKEIIEKDIKKRTFLGIKIYPCLGYLPSHPKLMDIYEIISKLDKTKHVPITTHCGTGSFYSIEKELNFTGFISHNVLEKYHVLELFNKEKFRDYGKYGKYYYVEQDIERKEFKKVIKNNPVKDCDGKKMSVKDVISAIYAHPLNWIPVLEGWNKDFNPETDNIYNKKLFIDLVHFGGSKELKEFLGLGNKIQNYNWTYTIISIMRDYNNVFTDLSANWDMETIECFGNKIINNIEFDDVKEKMMFGSDFFCYTYFKFNPAYNYRYFMKLGYDEMFTRNPEKFLFGY